MVTAPTARRLRAREVEELRTLTAETAQTPAPAAQSHGASARHPMEPPPVSTPGFEPASLVVIDPNGHRTRVPHGPAAVSHRPLSPESSLIIRDSRASRTHAQHLAEAGEYWIEDLKSRHGTFVNGKRVTRQALHNSDKIEFGAQDSYQLIFALDGAELKRLMDQLGASEKSPPSSSSGSGRQPWQAARHPGPGAHPAKLLLRGRRAGIGGGYRARHHRRRARLPACSRIGHGLETRVARHRKGHKLHDSDLRVPREVLHRALQHRRELLSMNFDPLGAGETRPQNSIADLELRSVVCVPLVRIRTGQGDATSVLSTGSETVGVLYMDSRLSAADLAGGNRELLQTLAIEASTVLENARLLEEERAKQQMEEELHLARTIQQSLLPGSLPSEGWMPRRGSSVASREVGGDYYDVTPVTAGCWAVVVADVSGKGVSSALLASLLQGALITATDHPEAMVSRVERLNRFLLEPHRRRKVCHPALRPAQFRWQPALRKCGALPAAGGAARWLHAGIGDHGHAGRPVGRCRVSLGRVPPRARRQAGDLLRRSH